MSQCFQKLDPVLKRHGYRGDGLLEVLAAAQSSYGSLSEAMLRHIARELRLPFSRVQGTATFYNLFRLSPPAPNQCLVCTGTACHFQGASQLLEELKVHIDTQTVELCSVRCVGTCSGAPLVVVNGEIWNHQTTPSVIARLNALLS